MKKQKIKWPNGARCAVMITLDLDGETTALKNADKSEWLYRSYTYSTYGPNHAMPRLLDIFGRNNVPATIFTPARIAVNHPELIKEIDRAGHEIGHHGFDHELFANYTPDQQRDIIKRSQEVFHKLIGKTAVSYRTPSGDFSPETPRILVEEGFICSASMRDSDIPYRTIVDGQATDLIEVSGKWELDDHLYFAYKFSPREAGYKQTRIASYDDVYENFKMEFDGAYRYGLTYITILHPQVIGRPGRAAILEQLIRYIKSYPDVWFTTGSELARWWHKNY